jgi:hypothetical protein
MLKAISPHIHELMPMRLNVPVNERPEPFPLRQVGTHDIGNSSSYEQRLQPHSI